MVTQLTRVLTAGLLLVPAIVRADKKVDETVAKAIGQLEKNRDAKDEPLRKRRKLAKDPGAEIPARRGPDLRRRRQAGRGQKAAAKAVEVSASGTPELRAQALSSLAAIELRAGAGKDALAHAQEAAKLSQLPEILANLANAQSRVSDPSALKTSRSS